MYFSKVGFVFFDFNHNLVDVDEQISMRTRAEIVDRHNFVKSMVVLNELSQSLLQNRSSIFEVGKRIQDLLVYSVQRRLPFRIESGDNVSDFLLLGL